MSETGLSASRKKTVDDLIGKVFGRLTVDSFAHVAPGRHLMLNCTCTCGNKKVVGQSNLKRGTVKSCGCLRRESSRERMLGNKYWALPPGESSRNKAYSQYKRGAAERGLSFNLSMAEYEHLATSDCFYCGAEPSREVLHTNAVIPFICNGIDRVDNNKGYKLKNCVTCCAKCNNLKGGATPDIIFKSYEFLMAKLELEVA